jgi:DNA polymerase III gamma/tau subunit
LKTFAKLLFNCENEYSAQEKRISSLIDSESFSDCLCFPAEAGKKLLVEDAEKILEESTLSPVEGDKKVFLIEDFSEANTQTQNKLLKLLEEPPQGVIFLLGATNAFSVLTTVLSRTKKLEILSFDIPSVVACLQRTYGDKYERSALELCTATADGNVGGACKLLEGGNHQILTENAFSLVLSPAYRLPAIIKQIGETAEKKELLTLLRLIFRDGLLLKTGQTKHLTLRGEKEKIQKVADTYSVSALLYAQEAITLAEKQVKFNAVFSQCLEICMANILQENNKSK